MLQIRQQQKQLFLSNTVKGQNGEKFCEVKIALGHLCVNFEELEISLKLSTFFENKRYF